MMTTLPRRWWRRATRRLGLLGMVGLGLVLAALLAAMLTPGLRTAADQSQSTWEQRRAALLHQGPRAPEPPSTQERLDQFVNYFPAFGQNAKDMQTVFEIAAQSQVNLPKGEYVVHAEQGSPFVTITATFPVHESYAALKSFVAQVLGDMPHSALEELRISRNDVNDVTLEATVRLSFVYRRP